MWWHDLTVWWHADGLQSLRSSRRLESIEKLPSRPAIKVVSLLIDMLIDPMEEVRSAAAARLGKLRNERAVAPLVRFLLHEEDPDVREVAAAALARFSAEGWVPSLTVALEDADFKVREAASWTLRTVGWSFIGDAARARVAVVRCDWPLAVELGSAAIPALQSALRTGTVILRREAADALCKIGDDAALAAIVEVLRDRRVEPGAREVAAWGLRSVRWAGVDASDSARAAIILGHWSEVVDIGHVAVGPLNIALKDPNLDKRRSAAETLGAIGGRPAVEALSATLVDPTQDASVRTVVVEQLGIIGGEQVIAVLVATLADNVWAVRATAATALASLHWTPSRDWDRALFAIAQRRISDAAALGPSVVRALAEALRFPPVSAVITDALVGMGQAGADALVNISRDSKSEGPLREAASAALASMGDARAVEPLYDMLVDADPAIRQSAVWALERLGWTPTKDSDRIAVALVNEDWAALRKVGLAAVEPLLRLVQEPDAAPELFATLEKIVETSPGRLSIALLRRISKLVDPPLVHAGSSAAATVALPVCTKLARTAKYELIRRGIMK